MNARLTTHEDLFRRDLGSALSMERDRIGVLDEFERAARRNDVKQLIRDNRRDVQEQLENLERSFALIGATAEPSPSEVSQAIAREGKSTIGRADQAVIDSIVVAETLQADHYEVGMFERLAAGAKARGSKDVARLIDGNLTTAKATQRRTAAFANAMAV